MILQYKGNSFISKAIRWQTRFPESHTAWMTKEGKVIEAWHKGGVCVNNIETKHNKGTRIDLYQIKNQSILQRLAIEDFLFSQVGKKYDFRSVARFISRRDQDPRDKDRWFCSELIFEACLKRANISLLKRIPSFRVNPGMISLSPLLEKLGTVEVFKNVNYKYVEVIETHKRITNEGINWTKLIG